MIQIRAIEQVRIHEKVEENENNDEEIKENINEEEDEEIRIIRLRFEEDLDTVTAFTKENIREKELLMKLKKVVAKTEIDRTNKILEKYLGNSNSICKIKD